MNTYDTDMICVNNKVLLMRALDKKNNHLNVIFKITQKYVIAGLVKTNYFEKFLFLAIKIFVNFQNL